ncbi:MAG TPA: hypothetical protein PKN85_00805 [Syntrophorhabdaceae bacterium]|nr:hypothetical protein [Syntrophorhabdaceae bacterium]HOD75653.1 hypothetical protein [Syntrophorhabdaceae bacterium]
MRCRVPVLVVMTMALLFSMAEGVSFAQSKVSCTDAVCGPGYRAYLQPNGSCMCILADCESIEGCPEPPRVPEDCLSIEGCNPPQTIEP